MKLYSLIMSIIASLFILTGCSSTKMYGPSIAKQNLVAEDWMNHRDLSARNWVRHADPWFLTGEPSRVEQYASLAPRDAAITTMSVNVGDGFDSIVVNGPFEVQMVGSQDRDCVFVMGPNEAAREVSVTIENHTLHINQVKDPKTDLKKVIIRLGVRNLRNITNIGKGSIFGRNIASDGLNISNCDCASIVLAGQMRLSRVIQQGTGTITVIGAVTPSLTIDVIGNGNVNVCGRVGVQRIIHKGNGCINIAGADTNSLTIDASGNGVTTVAGSVNLKCLNASDCSRVYVYALKSQRLSVSLSGNAHVGLAGCVMNMNIDLTDASHFGGQYLRGASMYVNTRNQSHANVYPDKKIFAMAADDSSIYIFGSPFIVSTNTSSHAVILPVWNDTRVVPAPSYGDGCAVMAPPRLPTLMPQKVYK